MSDLSLEHYQRIVAELQDAIAVRSRAEFELDALESNEEDSSSLDSKKDLDARVADLERQLVSVEEEYHRERDEIEQRYRSDVASANAEHHSITVEVQRVAEEKLAEIEHQYEENTWMLASLLDDDAENSPKRQYESLKTQLQESRDRLVTRWDAIAAVYTRAVEIVEQRRQHVGPFPESQTVGRTRKDALIGFDAAEMEIHSHLERLGRQQLPRLFAGVTTVLLFLGFWGGLFAIGYFLVDPAAFGVTNVKPVMHVLLSGGVSFGVCVVAFTILWGIAGRQTRSVFDPLQHAVSEARTLHQQWLNFAKEELQQQERAYRERYDALVERRDNATKKFASERDQGIAAVQKRRENDLREPAVRREAKLQDALERKNTDLRSSEAVYQHETNAIHTRIEQERSAFEAEQQRTFTEREVRRQQMTAAMVTAWQSRIAQLAEQAAASQEANRQQFADWSQVLSSAWSPAETIPTGIRIGDYQLDLKSLPGGIPDRSDLIPAQLQYSLPAVLPFPTSPSLLLEASGAGRAEASSILQVSMLRLLTLLPPGKVRLTILDPVGLGENFSAFMHLADFDELLISNRIWTEATHIEEQLAKLTEHMESVFQKYLRNEFESLEEYNQHAGEVAEPYRILIVANFPTGFSERAAQRLVSIATSGPRCGVYTFVSVDVKQPRPHGFDLTNLEANATTLRWKDEKFVVDLPAGQLPLRADAPPAASDFAAIVRKIGDLSRHVRRVEVSFLRVAPSESEWWTGDTRREVECPLGRAGATKLQHLRLGIGTSQHVLIAGKTGSGKSTLLHILITNLALRYSSNEVEFYLIDFKKGVEFKTYASHGLPHARVVAIESDREFGVSVLERLDALLKERGDLFREAGVQDVGAFRDARPGVPLPRVLLIVDEFQEFFTEDDRYAQTASLLLDRLVRQGRAFGIHVLLGSQTLGGAYSLARTTIGQMAVRIALQCSESDAHLILSEDNTAARLLTRPGEAIYNDANGMLEGNSPFQVAWLGDEQQGDYLDRIRELATKRGLNPAPPIVFEGNVPADPARNPALLEKLGRSRKRTAEVDLAPLAWLGEAVAITGPTRVTFRRQSGANVLMVGQDGNAAQGILAACLVALSEVADPVAEESAGQGGLQTNLFVLSGDIANQDGSRWRALSTAMSGRFRIGGPNDANSTISQIVEELERRRNTTEPAPSLFLLIEDISRIRDLKKADDDFGFGGFDRDKTKSLAQHLAEILKEGPAFGIHTVVWCDSYNNLDRWLGRQLIREFEMRVGFQMSAADSSNLIDSPAASRLGANRAILYLDDRGTIEKFRPYGPPSDAWLQAVMKGTASSAADNLENADELDIDEWVIT